MELVEIAFQQEEVGACPRQLLVSMTVEEAALIATLVGKMPSGKQVDSIYSALVGDVFNRYWQDGLREALKNMELSVDDGKEDCPPDPEPEPEADLIHYPNKQLLPGDPIVIEPGAKEAAKGYHGRFGTVVGADDKHYKVRLDPIGDEHPKVMMNQIYAFKKSAVIHQLDYDNEPERHC